MTNMTTEETFKFIELYQSENCLWNPKNKNHKNKKYVNDSWKRISEIMDIPVHELKKKKDNLLATFRINLRRRNASITLGADTEDVYQPIWIFYDAMAAFLEDVYECTSIKNSEEKTESDYEEATWIVQSSDTLPEADDDDADILDTKEKTIRHKRRAKDSLEFTAASKKMNTSSTALINALIDQEMVKEEDECDLFCKMLAKQIREYPKLEREEIMYELHGVMMTKRRQYNKTIQSAS